jgi:hypothetical protein
MGVTFQNSLGSLISKCADFYCTLVSQPASFKGLVSGGNPRRVTVSTARRAIDSSFRRILSYAAEIIISIILLVIICLPLIFTIPAWFQHVLFGTPRTELSINLIAWFGYDGALWMTLLLGLVSFSISYLYILKIKPGSTPADEKEEVGELETLEEEDESTAEEDMQTAEVAAEDQEDEELLELDDVEEALEDMEENEEEIDGDD